MKKSILVILLLLIGNLTFSQTHKIVKLLNEQLQKEYNKYYDEADKERFELTQPYKIDEKGVLSFVFSENDNQYNGKTTYYRTVPIDKIIRLDKDMNVIFVTDGEEALEVVTTYDSKGNLIRENNYRSSIFQTAIHKEKQNERFRKALIKAFKKTGYAIESEYWWD